MEKTIVALYDDLEDAQQAVRDLEGAGFPRSDISLVARQPDDADIGGTTGGETGEPDAVPERDLLPHSAGPRGTSERRSESAGTEAGTGAGTGAVVGGLVGGTGGLLAGLGLLAIPGIGPVVAAGPIAATLIGAGLGAAAGGLLGALIGLGVPEEEAHGYAEGVRRGGTLVMLKLTDAEVDRAVAILDRHAPIDVEERRETWRQSGWERFDESASPYPAAESVGTRDRAATRPATGTEQRPPRRVRVHDYRTR